MSVMLNQKTVSQDTVLWNKNLELLSFELTRIQPRIRYGLLNAAMKQILSFDKSLQGESYGWAITFSVMDGWMITDATALLYRIAWNFREDFIFTIFAICLISWKLNHRDIKIFAKISSTYVFIPFSSKETVRTT